MEHRLPHDPVAAGMARRLVIDLTADRLPPDRLDELALMVSEIATNAVKHAPPEEDGRIGLRLGVDGDVIRVVVVDGGPEFSFDQATFDNARGDSHFGLSLVDALADRWGLSLDGRKAVWFEVDTV